MWGKRNKLLRRCHPKTGQLVQEHRNDDGSLWIPSDGTYAAMEMRRRLVEAGGQHVGPEGFAPYVPEVFNGNGKNSALQRDENAAGRCMIATRQGF